MAKIKRSVIQIANSTQLVSLPRKWALKYNIQKGDELEIEEDGDRLVISTNKEISSNKTEIDFRGKGALIHRALSSLYRGGYDEIKIYFKTHSELDIVQSTINQELIGFEIIEQGEEYIIAKQVSHIDHSEFDLMLKRSFIFLISVADECLEALKTNNTNALKNLILRDVTINKLTDYCRRALNKKESFFKHVGPGYTQIEYLEKIGDGYRDICKYASQNKMTFNTSVIDLLFEINLLLKEAYKLFYAFNLGDMEKFLMKKDKIDYIILKPAKNIQKSDVILLIYLNSLSNNIFYLNGPLMINSL